MSDDEVSRLEALLERALFESRGRDEPPRDVKPPSPERLTARKDSPGTPRACCRARADEVRLLRRTGTMGDSPAASEVRDAGRPPAAGPPLDAPVPFLHRLSTKVLGVVALLAIAALAAVWIAERRFSNHMVTEAGRSTAVLGDAIQAATRNAMLAAAPGHSYEELQEIAALQEIDLIRVLDMQGRVRFSTEAAEIGAGGGQGERRVRGVPRRPRAARLPRPVRRAAAHRGAGRRGAGW